MIDDEDKETKAITRICSI